jgi:hypothetical protein
MLALSLLMVWWNAGAGPPLECTVRVEGMPVSSLASHRLRAGDSSHALGGREVQLALDPGLTEVELVGPRYGGKAEVSPERCADTVSLRARALPVRLEFPCPPPDMVVVCRKCPADLSSMYLPGDFPSIPFEDAKEPIVIDLKAPAYRTARRTIDPLPGVNVVDAGLTPL